MGRVEPTARPRRAPVAHAAQVRLVLIFDLVRLSAVPWLSGRASASYAEGRWFDPSRDHTPFSLSAVRRSRFAILPPHHSLPLFPLLAQMAPTVGVTEPARILGLPSH